MSWGKCPVAESLEAIIRLKECPKLDAKTPIPYKYRQIDIFYLPYELAIVILHTAEKKAVASHHAERTPSGPPSGVLA